MLKLFDYPEEVIITARSPQLVAKAPLIFYDER